MPKAGSFEGHPFTVEVGLSFGGDKCKEGITVHRFANRIPLLFEGGSDVATKVANTDVKWNNYKLKSKVDKLGIFVSICSTKIPFKGTGKEFISAQNAVYRKAIKQCIFRCANQLKSQVSGEYFKNLFFLVTAIKNIFIYSRVYLELSILHTYINLFMELFFFFTNKDCT